MRAATGAKNRVSRGRKEAASMKFTHKRISVETDLDRKTARTLLDELLRHRLFMQAENTTMSPQDHTPSFFHIEYKKRKVSVLIQRDMQRQWSCRLFSIQKFSESQPPLLVIP